MNNQKTDQPTERDWGKSSEAKFPKRVRASLKAYNYLKETRHGKQSLAARLDEIVELTKEHDGQNKTPQIIMNKAIDLIYTNEMQRLVKRGKKLNSES